MTQTASTSFGNLLRDWRQRRSLSQLALSAEADISQRHLSFMETGRAEPSRAMVLRLAERLDLPLRERNALLTAAGFAPVYDRRDLDHPSLAQVARSVDAILAGHEPYPALAVDRHWNLLRSNSMLAVMMREIDPSLLVPPVNVLRASLHPKGLASRIANFRQWREHVLMRLEKAYDLSADRGLSELAAEIAAYPVPAGSRPYAPPSKAGEAAIAVPFELETPAGRLSLITATTVFGTALDVTVAELTIETFFPADRETAEALHAIWRETAPAG